LIYNFLHLYFKIAAHIKLSSLPHWYNSFPRCTLVNLCLWLCYNIELAVSWSHTKLQNHKCQNRGEWSITWKNIGWLNWMVIKLTIFQVNIMPL